MPASETQMLMDMVEKKTGYGVSILVDDTITTHAGMDSATPSRPMHIIKVNPSYEKFGDYLIALQCAMLLIKWGDPNRIPDFAVTDAISKELVQKFAGLTEKQGLTAEAASQYAGMIVTGVLQQLNSIPIQMISMDMISELCPGLWEFQQESVRNEIREASRNFSKRIQKMTPKMIFDQNASMNAAYAIRWSQISGNRTLLMPYRSLGYINKGNRLIQAYDEIAQKPDPDRYTETVDSWAKILKMDDWYEWRYRKGVSDE